MGTKDVNEKGNYDEVNISSVEAMIEREREDQFREKRAYTMLQNNAPCTVNVTQSSRQKCAKALLK